MSINTHMKLLASGICLAAGMCVYSGSTAFAQQPPAEQADKPGYPVGPLYFTPKMKATGGYDTNVDRLPGGKADFSYSLAAIASFESRWQQHEVKLDAGAGIRRYLGGEYPDGETYAAAVSGRYDLSPASKLKASAEYRRDLSSPSSLEVALGGQKAVNDTLKLDTGLDTMIGGTGISLTAGYVSVTELNAEDDDESAVAANLDRINPTAGLDLLFLAAGPVSPVVQLRYSDMDYEAETDAVGADPDTSGYSAQAGLKAALSPTMSLFAVVGLARQEFAAAAYEDVDTVVATANLTLLLPPSAQLVMLYNRNFFPLSVPGIPGFIADTFGLNGGYRVDPVTFKAGFTRTQIATIVTPIEGEQWSFNVGAEWPVNAWMSLDVGYAYEERTTQMAMLAYDNHAVVINLDVSF